MRKIPIIPLIIGVIFTLSVGVIIATTFMLKKDLLHEQGLQLQGKYENRYNASFVGSQVCKNCHERTYLNWRTSLHSRMMKDAKLEPYANIGDFESQSKERPFVKTDVDYTLGSQWKQMYLKRSGDDIIVLPAQYNVTRGEWKEYYPDDKKKRDWVTQCAG